MSSKKKTPTELPKLRRNKGLNTRDGIELVGFVWRKNWQ